MLYCIYILHLISTPHTGIVSRVISCGGVDLLAQSLRTHVACDDIIIWSCRTLCNCILTLDTVSPEDRTICQNKFSQQLVLEILIHEFVERLNILSLLAAQWILKSIGCLARRHEHNMLTFVELGVCPQLQRVVAQFSLEHEKIAEAVCWVIGNISYPSEDAQQRWGAGGACGMVMSVLKRHVGSEETVQGESVYVFFFVCILLTVFCFFYHYASFSLVRGVFSYPIHLCVRITFVTYVSPLDV